MRGVSSRFLATVTSSHKMVTRAKVLTSYQTGLTPTGTEIPILGGDVTSSANAKIRSTLELTTSAEFFDLLKPYGNEIFVERGIDYGDGSTEWVGLGYFRISSLTQESAPNGELRVTASDRMSGIIDARLEAPVQFPVSDTLGSVFEQLVSEVYPAATIEYDFDPDASPFTSSHIAEEKRYEFLRELATSRGKEMYFDHRGILVVKSAPDPSMPVFTVQGGANGVLVKLGRDLSRDGVYNSVVAVGETTDGQEPVRAVARDMDPASPTYWAGSFGKVPRFFSSPFVQTYEQAADAAVSLLKKSIGLPYNVDFEAVPNPALEPLDPVMVSGKGFLIETLTIPLVADEPLTATCTDRPDTNIEVE